MPKQLDVELVPVEGDSSSIDFNLSKSKSCAAIFMRNAIDWKKSALEIRWDAAERVFFVEFTGNTQKIDPTLSDILSKRVPLQIAHASRCDCSATLELGNFTVSINDSDFKFKAEYSCPTCRIRLSAEKSGLKRVLENWFSGVRRIEIKATGVRLDRTATSSRPSLGSNS